MPFTGKAPDTSPMLFPVMVILLFPEVLLLAVEKKIVPLAAEVFSPLTVQFLMVMLFASLIKRTVVPLVDVLLMVSVGEPVNPTPSKVIKPAPLKYSVCNVVAEVIVAFTPAFGLNVTLLVEVAPGILTN